MKPLLAWLARSTLLLPSLLLAVPPVTVSFGPVVVPNLAAVEGIQRGVEVIEFQSGLDPSLRKRPGPVVDQPVRFLRPFSDDPLFRDWFQQTLTGKSDRRDVTIDFSTDAGQTNTTVLYPDAFPIAWQTSPTNPQVFTESLLVVADTVITVTVSRPLRILSVDIRMAELVIVWTGDCGADVTLQLRPRSNFGSVETFGAGSVSPGPQPDTWQFRLPTGDYGDGVIIDISPANPSPPSAEQPVPSRN